LFSIKKAWRKAANYLLNRDEHVANLVGVIAQQDEANARLVEAIQAQAGAMALLEDRNNLNTDRATATIAALVMMHGGSVVVSRDVAGAALAGDYDMRFVSAEDGSTTISLEVVERTAGVSDAVSETPEEFERVAANNSAALDEMARSNK
jgi:hypothetical protein